MKVSLGREFPTKMFSPIRRPSIWCYWRPPEGQSQHSNISSDLSQRVSPPQYLHHPKNSRFFYFSLVWTVGFFFATNLISQPAKSVEYTQAGEGKIGNSKGLPLCLSPSLSLCPLSSDPTPSLSRSLAVSAHQSQWIHDIAFFARWRERGRAARGERAKQDT